MGGDNFCLGGPAGGDGMWRVMALCGGVWPSSGGWLGNYATKWGGVSESPYKKGVPVSVFERAR